jgi:hypothetical protein
VCRGAAFAYAEGMGHLLVGETKRDEPEHFSLACGDLTSRSRRSRPQPRRHGMIPLRALTCGRMYIFITSRQGGINIRASA